MNMGRCLRETASEEARIGRGLEEGCGTVLGGKGWLTTI